MRGKIYAGNRPDENLGWKQIGSCKCKRGEEWLIYSRKQENSDVWETCKIVAAGMVGNKANYWFCFNRAEKKMAGSRDLALMQANRPDLYALISKKFSTAG